MYSVQHLRNTKTYERTNDTNNSNHWHIVILSHYHLQQLLTATIVQQDYRPVIMYPRQHGNKWFHSFWGCCSPVDACMEFSLSPFLHTPRVLYSAGHTYQPINPLFCWLTTTGLCGCFCPCCLFGKTQARLEDPSLRNFSHCNGDVSTQTSSKRKTNAHPSDFFQCCLFTTLSLCGMQWILQTIRRGDMRDRFGITEGNCCTDCLVACCCPCCGLVQQEKEAKTRLGDGQEGPPPMGYQPPIGMTYRTNLWVLFIGNGMSSVLCVCMYSTVCMYVLRSTPYACQTRYDYDNMCMDGSINSRYW